MKNLLQGGVILTMKKIVWQVPLLLLLILGISLGLSYLVLNEKQVSELDDEPITMSIALVNEDDGDYFNDEKIVFGDEFASSVIKNDNHDWYVVSRGVAENGYERSIYDMMIVIPPNFSENSLSINEQSPEKVTLNYKINATGHEDVKAEAEKVAGNILKDFNRRLIDVYFASIIGNLQDAQDDISDIIGKEEQLTNLYTDHIQSPLANYTDKFQNVQNYTNLSKESYGVMEDLMMTFENDLIDDVDNKKSYLLDLNDAMTKKEEVELLSGSFTDLLEDYTQKQKKPDLMNQLRELEEKNNKIHQQFVTKEEQKQEDTLIQQKDIIKKHFDELNADSFKFRDALNEKLGIDLDDLIEDAIRLSFHDEELSENPDVFIGELLGVTAEEMIKNKIKEKIHSLPTLNIENIKDTGLSEEVVRDINNVILITKKHIKENGDRFDEDKNSGKLLANRIKELKAGLVSEGIFVEDSIELSSYDSNNQYLYVKIPNLYDVESIRLFVGEQTLEITEDYAFQDEERKVIQIPLHDHFVFDNQQELKIKMHFTLNSSANLEDVDIFAPFVWQWDVAQEGMEEILEDEEVIINAHRTSDKPLSLTSDTKGFLGACADKEDDECDKKRAAQEIEDKNEESEDEEGNEGIEDNVSEDAESNEGIIDEDEEEDTNDDTEVETITVIEKILMKNNYMNQKVHSKIIKNPGDELLKSIPNMIVDYYQLLSMYEIYYGLDMHDENISELLDESVDEFPGFAQEGSLYNFFNTEDISNVLESFTIKKIKDNVISDVEKEIEKLNKQLDQYDELLETAQGSSDKLATIISTTSTEAIHLNENVTDLLVELSSWRETSEKLTGEQVRVTEHNQDAHSAVLNLDANYQPLLMASESLANLAESNSNSGETVYRTFEQINEEAGEIQQSGVGLVNHATDLADKLTEKTIEDVAFMNNFSGVLANSRIGDRQNEELYDFLSNPVEAKNDGLITEQESFIPYFLVIIMSVLALFTAYAISMLKITKQQDESFEKDNSMIKRNLPYVLLIVGIGAIEGVVTGLVSSYLLSIETPVLWIALISLLMISMVVISTYLLRQLKMIGMFIILAVLSLYLFVTRSLGFSFEHSEIISTLRVASPLQHVETLIANILDNTQGVEGVLMSTLLISLIIVLGTLLNLFVIKRDEKVIGEIETNAEAS